MSVFRCLDCKQYVEWMATRFGKRMLFDSENVAYEIAPLDEAWVPGWWNVKGSKRVVMAPIAHCSREKQDGVRWVRLLHRCPKREQSAKEKSRQSVAA